MKKIISLIIIATMLVFSFASCKKDKNNKSDDTNDVKEVRTTITAEEWAALDTIINYTLVMTGTSSYTFEGQTQTSSNGETVKSSATAEYEINSYTYDGESETDECYYVVKDEKTYVVRKNDDGNWVATTSEWEPDSIYDYINVDDEMTFADLTYDETKKAYTYTVTEEDAQITYTYYFEDGKLVKLEGVMTGESDGAVMTATATIIISNIGTTVVDVPANITYPES